ncbi:MAG: c-type cytochrome [Gammaproteobacteria bacterium]|nr:c-type cytochrome [Gammaproteobacteria bacterium]
MHKQVALFLGLFVAGSITIAHAAGNAAAGKARSVACQACHGVDGNSASPAYPKLAGQSAGYLVKQLTDFKDGKRTNPIMSGMAASLSKQDMEDVAAYFSSQKPAPGVTKASPDTIMLGERLFRGGNRKFGISACMSCHGPAGAGIPPRFPRLAGQHAAYVEAQLVAFKNGQRTNDDHIMQSIAFRMSLAQINAVSQYIQGLH